MVSIISLSMMGWGLFIMTISLENAQALEVSKLPIKGTEIISTGKKIEPSGLSIKDNILYIISDNARMEEVNLSNFSSRKYKIKRKDRLNSQKNEDDYEGITFDNNGILYAVVEGRDDIAILNVNPLTKKYEVSSYIKIDRKFNGQTVLKKGGDGLESIVFWKSVDSVNYFIVTNQSNKTTGKNRSSILVVEATGNVGKITAYMPSEYKDLSGATFLKDKLVIISDTENKLLIFNINCYELSYYKAYDLIGVNQEGIVFNKNHMYIAQDSGNVLKVTLEHSLLKE